MNEIVLVGTGAAFSSPVLYCPCKVCRSKDAKDKRVESGVLIKEEDTRIMFDAGRSVYNRLVEIEYNNVEECHSVVPVDAVAVTHSHFDHWGAIDELAQAYRRCQRRKGIPKEDILPLKVFAHVETWEPGPGRVWGFLMEPSRGGTRGRTLEYVPCRAGVRYRHGKIALVPFVVLHGPLPGLVPGCTAFLVSLQRDDGPRQILITGDLAPHDYWVSWKSDLPFGRGGTFETRLDLVIMEANSPESRPHSGHLSAEEGLTMLQYWQPKRAILTHLCHEPDEKGGGDAGKFTHAELPEQLKRMCTAKGIDATLNKGQDNQYLEVHWSENKKTQLEIGYDGQRVQV